MQKVHAIVGGFHLGPAPADYLKQVVAEIKKLEPDVLIPMHCSGLNFSWRRRQMPGKVLTTTTGTHLGFERPQRLVAGEVPGGAAAVDRGADDGRIRRWAASRSAARQPRSIRTGDRCSDGDFVARL